MRAAETPTVTLPQSVPPLLLHEQPAAPPPPDSASTHLLHRSGSGDQCCDSDCYLGQQRRSPDVCQQRRRSQRTKRFPGVYTELPPQICFSTYTLIPGQRILIAHQRILIPVQRILIQGHRILIPCQRILIPVQRILIPGQGCCQPLSAETFCGNELWALLGWLKTSSSASVWCCCKLNSWCRRVGQRLQLKEASSCRNTKKPEQGDERAAGRGQQETQDSTSLDSCGSFRDNGFG